VISDDKILFLANRNKSTEYIQLRAGRGENWGIIPAPRKKERNEAAEISICACERKFVGQQKSRKVSRVKGFSLGWSLNKIQATFGVERGRDLSSKRAQTESDDKRLFRRNEQLLQSFNSVVNWASPLA